MLSIRNLHAGYGSVSVLQDINLEIRPSEIIAIVGANGAGKSTLVRAICGLLKTSSGEIRFRDREITHMPAHLRARAGLAVVLENRRLWGELSVKDNLRLAHSVGERRNSPTTNPYSMNDLYDLFPVLHQRESSLVELLSGGEQQMVAIARALLLQPDLLIMDEPSAGLSPLMVKNTLSVIQSLKSKGMSMLLVEQNVAAIAHVADRGYVINLGRLVHEVPQDGWRGFLKSESLFKAYFGG